MNIRTLIASSILASGAVFAVPASAADISACLITKTDINPFFVKMKEGATAKAQELGVQLSTYAGKVDGDHETQVQAVESCIASGAKGILITASDTKAITDVVKQARDNGVLVIALDTRTGETRWRTSRAASVGWGTPIAVTVGDHDELIVSSQRLVQSYNPITGDELWQCGGMLREVIPTPVVGHGLVFCA